MSRWMIGGLWLWRWEMPWAIPRAVLRRKMRSLATLPFMSAMSLVNDLSNSSVMMYMCSVLVDESLLWEPFNDLQDVMLMTSHSMAKQGKISTVHQIIPQHSDLFESSSDIIVISFTATCWPFGNNPVMTVPNAPLPLMLFLFTWIFLRSINGTNTPNVSKKLTVMSVLTIGEGCQLKHLSQHILQTVCSWRRYD